MLSFGVKFCLMFEKPLCLLSTIINFFILFKSILHGEKKIKLRNFNNEYLIRLHNNYIFKLFLKEAQFNAILTGIQDLRFISEQKLQI